LEKQQATWEKKEKEMGRLKKKKTPSRKEEDNME